VRLPGLYTNRFSDSEQRCRHSNGDGRRCYGGAPWELPENSMRLYARRLLAVLKSWGAARARVIAAK